MSFSFQRPQMIHAGVNTDPLQMFTAEDITKSHYGLKLRDISHTKVSGVNELKVWYDFGEKLGEGAFGTVMALTDKATRQKWAVKTVAKSAGSRVKLLEQEIQILRLIRHPHIIYLDKIFESSKKIFMVFERCHGDFAKIYKERKPFDETVSKKIISEVVDAVAYLHKYDIVHRDLKMENILLGENPEDPTDEYYIKLTDFGLSALQKGKGVQNMLHEFCGTLLYMAPEMITIRSYSRMCDMWSVGIILYMLVEGRHPFSSNNEKEIQDQICTSEPQFDNGALSHEVKDLILLLLDKNPVKRITATEVLHHPWILNKKVTAEAPCSNIMDKMKEWKEEMKVEAGAVSDWVSTPNESLDNTHRTSSKTPMHLPKTNINFDRVLKRQGDPKRKSRNHHELQSKGGGRK